MDSITISKALVITDDQGVDHVFLQVHDSEPMFKVDHTRQVSFQATPGMGEEWVRKMIPNTSYEVISRQRGVVKKVEK